MNFVGIALQIIFVALLPGANDPSRGIFELMLAVFIGLDPIYLILDVFHDYICYTTIMNHVTFFETQQNLQKRLATNNLIFEKENIEVPYEVECKRKDNIIF